MGELEHGVELIHEWCQHPDISNVSSKNIRRNFTETDFEKSIEGQNYT